MVVDEELAVADQSRCRRARLARGGNGCKGGVVVVKPWLFLEKMKK